MQGPPRHPPPRDGPPPPPSSAGSHPTDAQNYYAGGFRLPTQPPGTSQPPVPHSGNQRPYRPLPRPPPHRNLQSGPVTFNPRMDNSVVQGVPPQRPLVQPAYGNGGYPAGGPVSSTPSAAHPGQFSGNASNVSQRLPNASAVNVLPYSGGGRLPVQAMQGLQGYGAAGYSPHPPSHTVPPPANISAPLPGSTHGQYAGSSQRPSPGSTPPYHGSPAQRPQLTTVDQRPGNVSVSVTSPPQPPATIASPVITTSQTPQPFMTTAQLQAMARQKYNVGVGLNPAVDAAEYNAGLGSTTASRPGVSSKPPTISPWNPSVVSNAAAAQTSLEGSNRRPRPNAAAGHPVTSNGNYLQQPQAPMEHQRRHSADPALETIPLSNGHTVSAPPPSSSATPPPPSSVSSTRTESRRTTASSGTFTLNRLKHRPSDRTHSIASSSTSSLSRYQSGRTGSTSNVASRAPIVYPALLSRVAHVFREKMHLETLEKDGLEYKSCFKGKAAVDTLAWIIKTTDRNLALLLGRALDAQRFFHDVTYEHRLRDVETELYVFGHGLEHVKKADVGPMTMVESDDEEAGDWFSAIGGTSSAAKSPQFPQDDGEVESDLPNGVFTLLTDCYSPTCTRDKLCYSISCPRRAEQQFRLNMSQEQSGLKRSTSRSSLFDDLQDGGDKLWINAVPKEVSDAVSKDERKRQEIIFELIYTERDFVRDLDTLQRIFIEPIRYSNVIPDEDNRERFIHEVFFNVSQIIEVNSKLARALKSRQEENHVVKQVGDIFAKFADEFDPFIWYGGHQPYSKYFLDLEISSNPDLVKFFEECERKPETRKLPIQSFIARPTTRLARYPLLMEAILKCTPSGNPDQTDIPVAIEKIKKRLALINVEAGKAGNRLRLTQLNDSLIGKPTDLHALNLLDENRQLIREGTLKKKTNVEHFELTIFLFDHMLLLTRKKKVKDAVEYKIHKKPIPLEMLAFVRDQEDTPTKTGTGKRANSIFKGSSEKGNQSLDKSVTSRFNSNLTAAELNKAGYQLTIAYLGRHGATHALIAPTQSERRDWKEKIEEQVEKLAEPRRIFTLQTVTDSTFPISNQVNCAAKCDQGRRVLVGTDDGLYLWNANDPRSVIRVLELEKVTSVEVLEDYNLILVLAAENELLSFDHFAKYTKHEKSRVLLAYTLDILEMADPSHAAALAKRGRKISSHVSFFRTGVCSNKQLVCVMKTSSFSSTGKCLEPVALHNDRTRGPLRRMLASKAEAMKTYREFFIPTESFSIHFLRSKLCIGCTKGFEIVDLETLNTQGLLDPTDDSLNFVLKRENVRPIAIFRVVSGDFLLCYDEFAFYVDKSGRRARPDYLAQWEGEPTAFSLDYPYILAYNSSFIEIRHVETGSLVQVLPTMGLRCLHAEAMLCAMDGPGTYQHIFSLSRPRSDADAPVSPAPSYTTIPSNGFQAGVGGFRPSSQGTFSTASPASYLPPYRP